MIEARYLEVDGSLAYVEMAGQGPAVFCIHTAGQSGVQWRAALRELSGRGYRVVVVDLPGHGRSEPAAGGPVRDLGDYARWCIRVMDELSLDRPYVMGCSIGGRIALDIATRVSERLSGVIAMAAEGVPGGAAGAAALERGIEDASSPSRSDRTYYGTLAVCGQSIPAERSELIAVMHRREDPIVTTCDLIGWFTHDLRGRLERIACPTHLVVGEDDFWLDPERVRWTAAQIPGGRASVLPGVGHYPMEELTEFSAMADGWLRELNAAG
jgi:pimeloyl-ACP methyl ester carboxylesterase